jgi:UDP-3-O-[3-hydroxymyristoyl] glucosamine N-acyltransferase
MPSNGITLSALAELVGAQLVGDGTRVVSGVAPIGDAEADQITFLANPRYREALSASKAGAVIINQAVPNLSMTQLVMADPYFGYAQVMGRFYVQPRQVEGISVDARVDAEQVGTDPDIGPFVTVASGTTLGDRVTLRPGVRIGANCRIGDDVVLHDNVVIYHDCEIGDRVTLHAGTVVGSDGFGYATHAGVHHKIPHVGKVVIEADVELGANCTVDRGVMGDTVIGAGSKLDNLVQVAHNVRMGRGCLMASQSGVSGSTKLGNYVVIGGQVGIGGHLEIGEQSMIGGKAGVTKNLEGKQMYSGFPAAPHRAYLKGQAELSKIPALREKIKHLVNRLDALETGKHQD